MENTLYNKRQFFKDHIGFNAILEDDEYIDFAIINEWFLDYADLVLWQVDFNGEKVSWKGMNYEKLQKYGWAK